MLPTTFTFLQLLHSERGQSPAIFIKLLQLHTTTFTRKNLPFMCNQGSVTDGMISHSPDTIFKNMPRPYPGLGHRPSLDLKEQREWETKERDALAIANDKEKHAFIRTRQEVTQNNPDTSSALEPERYTIDIGKKYLKPRRISWSVSDTS